MNFRELADLDTDNNL